MKLSDFAGRWIITRKVINAVGPDARFDGVAEFAGGEGGLILTERGEMRMQGATPMVASRVYHWRESPDGIDVFFDDGRFFHHISGGEQPEAHHDCAPDVYDVAYDFSHWPTWSAVWQVTGPRKDYRMESRYTLA
ncbi:DUF6314 family protein [Pseudooceanicola sp. MF1-13]|uniref:DUF6314 family protein n=1 Tax=Pseudooceanicola sp. MF1-13 TaxID=3379095 RepID=UPI003892364E